MPLEAPLVLVVDDSQDQRVILRESLEFSGFKVSEASDGEQAVEKAHLLAPNVILMDLKMPVLDGFEACRRIKRSPRTKLIPVIAITAYGPDEYERSTSRMRWAAFLQKPVPMHALTLEIEKVIEEIEVTRDRTGKRRMARRLYPRREGKYVIDLPALPEALHHAVQQARRCHGLAVVTRSIASKWTRLGYAATHIASKRRLVRRYEEARDVALDRLWTFHRMERPVDFTVENLMFLEM